MQKSPVAFVCSRCSERFATGEDLKAHIAQHDRPNRDLQRPGPKPRIPTVPPELLPRDLQIPGSASHGPWSASPASALLPARPAVRGSGDVRLGFAGFFGSFLSLRWLLASTLPQAALLSAVGLAIQEAAYQLAARSGSDAAVQVLFFFGLMLVFVPCAGLLVRRDVPRSTRIAAGLLMGGALLVSQWLPHPLLLAGYDELLHLTSLSHLVDGRHFFTPNTVMPVSPYYPGLELFTAGVHWMMGLSGLPSAFLVVLSARALLLVTLFLVVERIAHSDRVAGLAIALYIANPQFYSFDAQYAYETLAVALAITALHYALRAVDRPASRRRALLASTSALALLAITHHITSWAMLLGLAAATAWLAVVGNRPAARVFFVLACLDALIIAGWTTFVAGKIGRYMGPMVRQAGDSLLRIVLREERAQTLFMQATGVRTPAWEVSLILVSVILWVGLLLAATFSGPSRRLLRQRRALWLLVVGAAGYALTLASHVSASAAVFGNRAPALVFFFVACWVAIWWIRSGSFDRRRRVAVSVVILATLMMGGVLLGAGPDYARVPGPYLVAADERSIDSHAMAVAEWARAHLPPGTRIAADRDNSALLAAVADLTPVTQASGSVNVGPLYFADELGPAQDQLVRLGRIRLLLVDRRLSSSLPNVGVYFESGETYDSAIGTDRPQKLRREELDKFSAWRGAQQIYDNGPISIYDLSQLQGLPPVRVSAAARPPGDLGETRWPILGGALLLGAYVLCTKRRTDSQDADYLERAGDAGLAAVVLFVCVGALLVATDVEAAYVAVPLLAMLFVVSASRGRRRRRLSDLPRPSRSTAVLGVATLLLLGATVLASIGRAVT